MRVFRVLKMARFISEANYLVRAIKASSRKIIVFVGAVLMVTIIVGALMYLIEGPENGFDSMFRGLYWSIVTMSTVGFGDITPTTTASKLFTVFYIFAGISLIGALLNEFLKRQARRLSDRASES